MDEKKKMLLADFALLLAATFWGMGFGLWRCGFWERRSGWDFCFAAQ